jgi:hypothetical protein
MAVWSTKHLYRYHADITNEITKHHTSRCYKHVYGVISNVMLSEQLGRLDEFHTVVDWVTSTHT